MHTPGIGRRAIAAAVAVVAMASTVAFTVVAPARPAEAAGVTTHGWMALEAIPLVTDPDLRALLVAHPQQVRAGAMLPDAGYIPGNTFGEEAHWQRYFDAYVARIKARTDCGEITDPHGPCADMIAHVLGMAAHGLGDEVWDWLFEPNVPDLGEYFVPEGGPFNDGGAESQMDLVAIHDHGVPRPVVPDLPDLDTILAAFADVGRSDVTASQFALNGLGELVWDVESSWVVQYIDELKAAMPWTSAHLRTAPGGVDFAAASIAGMWAWMWDDLQGFDPTTTVVNTYPAAGQIDVPATGWERSIEPGTHPGRGGARTRVAAVLSYARPYGTPTTPYAGPGLPAGSFTIRDVATGTSVAPKAGFPRSVPYGGEAGQKVIGAQPAADLQPCTWYEASVAVDAPLTDARGGEVEPHSWRFRTDDGAGGTACPATAGDLVGTVTDGGGGPVDGALVLAYAPTDGMAPTAKAVTSVDGAFHLPALPDGSYRLAVLARVHDDLAITWAGGATVRTAGTSFPIPATTTPIEVVLQPAGALRGTVTGPGGAPVAGALVGAFGPNDSWVPTGLAVTGPSGAFDVERLPAQPYRLLVVPPQGIPAMGWYADPATTDTRSWVTAGSPAALELDVRLSG